VADRTAQLLLTGLSRAVAEPGGLPLLAGRSSPGLFAANAAGRQAAQRCQDQGFLSALPADSRTRNDPPAYTLTEKGFQHLVSHAPPKQLVEDFLRVLEARQAQASELLTAVRQMQATLDGLRTALTALGGVGGDSQDDLILTALRRRQGSGDCPLSELFTVVTSETPLSIGQFHDTLRRLYASSRIYLHPWTGPLHDMPEPKFALLIGHLILYYASPRA
jgi:hypothetical protein